MPLKFEEKQNLTNELTLVLLRGNGSPRTLRVPIPELKRFVISLSAAFVALVICCAVLLSAYLYQRKNLTKTVIVNVPNPNGISAPSAPTQTAPAPIVIAPSGANDDKEAAGLREDIAKLHAELDSRKTLSSDVKENLALLMISPKSSFVSQAEAFMKIKNASVKHDVNTKETFLNFELHNTEPNQKQIRGYIIVLAKSNNSVFTYPANAFSAKENILLNFTKGETFAVSRFRQAQGYFKNLPADISSYQIFLFNTLGKILASQQVEDR